MVSPCVFLRSVHFDFSQYERSRAIWQVDRDRCIMHHKPNRPIERFVHLGVSRHYSCYICHAYSVSACVLGTHEQCSDLSGNGSMKRRRKPTLKGVGFYEANGADRDRTDDLLHAMQALSQLSYGPNLFFTWQRQLQQRDHLSLSYQRMSQLLHHL